MAENYLAKVKVLGIGQTVVKVRITRVDWTGEEIVDEVGMVKNDEITIYPDQLKEMVSEVIHVLRNNQDEMPHDEFEKVSETCQKLEKWLGVENGN